MARFDIDPNHPSDLKEIATLAELTAELTDEAAQRDETAPLIEMKTLRPLLDFVEKVSGVHLDDPHQPLPLSTVKIIKRLYQENLGTGRQLFNLLAPPTDSGRSTLELRESGSGHPADDGINFVERLLSSIRTEIEPETLERIDRSLLTPAKLLSCIDRESREDILGPIYMTHGRDTPALIKCLKIMEGKTLGYKVRQYGPRSTPGEMVYTYLRTLEALHFFVEYRKIITTFKIKEPIKPITEQLEALSQRIGAESNAFLHPVMPMTSIAEFPDIVKRYDREIRSMIGDAIDIKKNKAPTDDHIAHAQKILFLFERHQDREPDLHAKRISLLDCVSAIATVMHQRQVGDTYQMYWQGLKKQPEGDPLHYLQTKKGVEQMIDEKYVPHGIMQALYARFAEFSAAFTSCSDRYWASKEFQFARLSKYAECFRAGDIYAIDMEVGSLLAISANDGAQVAEAMR